MRLILFLLFISTDAFAQLKIAVIDSGTDVNIASGPFCNKPESDLSEVKHGTSISDLISKNAGDADFCLYSLRAYSQGIIAPYFDYKKYIRYLKLLTKMHIDILNLSIEGTIYDKTEAHLIKQLLDSGVIIIVAAGNDNKQLEYKDCTVYPACDDPRIVVVSTNIKSSNYGGRIDITTHRNSWNHGSISLTGTSQATAIETGRFIHFLNEHK